MFLFIVYLKNIGKPTAFVLFYAKRPVMVLDSIKALLVAQSQTVCVLQAA